VGDHPGPPTGFVDIREEKPTFLRGVVAHFVDAVLEPMLAPFTRWRATLCGPYLAFVRDEIPADHPSELVATRRLESPLEGPNLLGNSGRRTRRSVLSGYAACDRAGLGLPAHDRDRLRHPAPVPLPPSPGPYCRTSGIPSHVYPAAESEFFGGGTRADAALSQPWISVPRSYDIDHPPVGVQYS